MKKGYWVVAYKSISDESATKAYAELAVPAIESFGGRFLARTSIKVHPHEAGLQQRTVIVEFDSYEIALAAYESEAYKKALQRLAQAQNGTSALSKGFSGLALAAVDGLASCPPHTADRMASTIIGTGATVYSWP
jgi:uncharacterized protein (DUF1330 family)